MNDAVIRLGTYSLYGFGLLATFSFLWGAFVYYKKAVSSHFEDLQILDSIVIAAFWAFIVGRLTYAVINWQIFWNHIPRIFLFSNFPGIDRWGAYTGILLGVFWTVRKVKGRVIDWFDLVSLGLVSGTAIFFAGLSLMAYSWRYALISLIYLILFIVFWNVEDNYRKYSWYRANKTSARSGLVLGFSILSLGLVSLVETVLHRRVDLITGVWSLILFVGGFVLVYIRSGRTVGEDIKIIMKKYGRKK